MRRINVNNLPTGNFGGLKKDREGRMQMNRFLKNVLRIVPYLVVCIMLTITWCQLISGDFVPTPRQWAATILVVSNLAVYFVRLRVGLIITGAILLLASFDFLAFTFTTKSTAIFFGFRGKEISGPYIQPMSLLLLLLFLILNLKFLIRSFRNVQ